MSGIISFSSAGTSNTDNVTPSVKTVDYTLPVALPDQGGESVIIVDYTLPKVLPDLSLEYWDLNLNASTLTMHLLNEADASSLDVTAITLQSALTAGSTYTLTDSTTASSDGSTIVIDLSVTDKAAIVGSGFCTSSSDSWLTFTTSALADLSANPIQSISNGRARQVTNYTSP